MTTAETTPTTPATPTTGELLGLKERVASRIRGDRERLVGLSHRIHSEPELSWAEHKASAAVAETMSEAGFDTRRGVYGLETAVEAVYGDGDLTVAICAEYDALPGVGHACGHNMIAAMSTGAALALAEVADAAGLRIKLLGTPAEEHGGGKVAMLTGGAFEDVAFSLMAHGFTGQERGAAACGFTAVERFEVTFTGRAAHAAGAPEKGVNAGSAATLALTAIGLARQQMPSATSVNAFVSLGGEATNVIAPRSVVQAEVRAYDLDTWRELKQRVLACFEGAAIATGCEWEHRQTEHPYAPMEHDEALASFWDANMTEIGRPLAPGTVLGGGSTDMGNVSQAVPAIHGMIAVRGSDAVPHHPDFAAAAATPEADDAVIEGAIALAWTVLDAALSPTVRADLLARQAARPEGATRVTLEI